MLKENNTALNRLVNDFNISLKQHRQFVHYIDLVESWTIKVNLLSKNDRSKIVEKHIFESLELVRHDLISADGRLLDMGSGAGFPGLPLAIFYPNMTVVLAESRRMRALFLQEAIDLLQLKNTVAVCERAENLAGILVCDYVTARAVGRLSDLWTCSRPLLQPNGILIAFKGGEVEQELSELKSSHAVSCKIILFSGQADQKKNMKKFVIVARQPS